MVQVFVNTTELETACRESAAIGDSAQYQDYTQARMLRELTDKLRTTFEDPVTKSRSGYWLHEKSFNTTPGKNRYRIPHRAVVGGLEAVHIATVAGGVLYEIPQIPVDEIPTFEGTPGRQGQPIVYAILGDQVELIPTPSTAISVKLTYYIRPSQLTPSQNNVSGTDRGRITSIANLLTLRQVTVNALPFDQNLTVPAAITSANQILDVVHPNGWHELSLVDAPQTIAGNVITFGGTDDVSDIELGDYVRVADQTDWPCLPVDFHRVLADAAATKILIELHLSEKANELGASGANDMTRFRSLLYPRVKSAPKQVGILRRSRGGQYPYGRFYG